MNLRSDAASITPITPIAAAEAQAAQHDIQHYMRPGTLMLPSLPPLSLYVHLPWCLRKCPYCDFNSHEWAPAHGSPLAVLPEGQLTARTQDLPEQRYVDALIADLEASLPLIWGRPVHSVFFGGGTPSLFSPAAIDRLLGAIRARLPLTPTCEITLEANPGTFETDRFRGFRQAGITRLSLGVQSFSDDALQKIGRVHSAAQAKAALTEAASCFDTFNIDLMYALPGQTLSELKNDLAQAMAFSPPHLSVYHLTIEPNTFFAKHPPVLPEDDLAWDMLDTITATTQAAGMRRYEVSAYAKPGHGCVHNLNYWGFGDYLGIGAGAHGKLSFAHRVVRQVRVRNPALYMARAEAGNAIAQVNEVARKALPFEYMLNALRLREGFNLQDFYDRTGLPQSAIAKALEEAQAKGLLERKLNHIQPTERGFDLLNDLQALFL